jgi:hypothetical protein
MREQQVIRTVSAVVAVASIAAAALLSAGSARAGEFYFKAGVPGFVVGWAQPLGSHFGLRLDAARVSTLNERRTENGIAYDATLKGDRTALLADWFVFGGGFRLTGGVTGSRYSLDLLATGSGGSITVGNNTYITTPADRLNVQIKLPSSMPYAGLGWGHQDSSGLRFSFDVGAKLGRATLSYALTGPWASRVTQADIDAELSELRDGVGKVRLLPQLTFGLGYSF